MPPLPGEATSQAGQDRREQGGTPVAGPPERGSAGRTSPGGIPGVLRRFERAVGARREDRSLWAWSVPLFTMAVTFVLVMVAHPGDLPLLSRLPVAIIGSMFMGGMSLTYLLASGEDEE